MGNDLTRSNQMGAAADEMERTRLAGEADFRKRMSTPPVAAVRGPLDNQVAMGEAMASLSNTDRYKLGGSGTAAEASEINQRNDIMKRLNTAMPQAAQSYRTRPGLLGGQDDLLGMNRPGLLGGQDDLLGMNLAGGGTLPPRQTSFGDRPMPPSTPLLYDNAPVRPIPPRAVVIPKPAQPVRIPLPPPEYPQERVRPAAPASVEVPPVVAGTLGLVTGDVVDAIRNRKVKNAAAADYADGTGRIDPVEELLKRTASKYGIENKPAPAPQPTSQLAQQTAPRPAPQPAPRKGLYEAFDERNKRLKDAANYACGTGRVGHAAGGIVRGKGGPTDDEVPMSVGGTDVNLSPREAVLPVKTVMALGGPDAVEDLIERTNGKPPVRAGLRAGGNYAAGAGGKEDPEELMQRISRKYGVDVPPAAPVVAQQAPVTAPARPDVRGAQQGAYKAMLGTVAKPFAYAIDTGLNLAANAAGYDRPDKQAFMTPVNDYVDEGLRQVAPVVASVGDSSQSIPEALGWKKRPDAPSSAPTTAVPVGQPQAPTTEVPVGQPQAPTAAAAAADIQARSMAAEGLRSGAQREMNLPPTQQQDVVNGGSLVQRGNVGLRSIANNPAVQDALNVANERQGTGVTYSTVKGADGKQQVMISGGPATKAQYIAADGTPTNDWTQTAQYTESKGLHARNKQALRDIEMENARSDMASALPFYQGRGLRTMATRLREDELAQKGQITPAQAAQLAMQREGLDATIANRKEDNARADASARAGESETHRKATDDLIKSWATEDGKLNDQKYAFLQKYASQFERPKGMSSAEHLGNLMDEFAIDTMGDTEGRHWLSAEGTWNGERTKWQKRAATDSLRRGAPLQSVEYHDPLTGRTIYQSDVNKLSPKQRKLFESRVYQ
jgi:hypothetical protein